MKLIVISPPVTSPGETDLVTAMLKNGLEHFHIHKTGMNQQALAGYKNLIPSEYYSRISSHESFPKFHSLDELKTFKGTYDYAFLSPVFDSISKPGHKSPFTDRMHRFFRFLPELQKTIQNRKIIALGGVDEDKIDLLRRTGFYGVAVLGAVWNSKDPLQKFIKLRDRCLKQDLQS